LEKPSEFEQYISGGTIDIDEFQFEILKKLEGITFQYTAKALPTGKIAIPIRIVKITKRVEREQIDADKDKGRDEIDKLKQQKQEIKTLELSDKNAVITDAGYLIGSTEAIADGFKLIGIKSSYPLTITVKQFGYDLFSQPLSTFAPVEKVPVGPDYVIGPDDEVKIVVWGSIEGQWSVVVDRDGKITLPKVGMLGVTGLTYKELKALLHKEFSKYFTGFEMNVGMGALRTMRVYVVGNASKPGAYTLSSLSTLVNAIFAAGGPSKTGTMRNIQVKRNGTTVVNFDMYDFLLKGDKTKDVRLMPEDVIFIPPIGNVAAIAGSVNNPAIYELKGETKIQQLMDMAGGLNAVAFKGRVQIERIVDGHKYIVFESDTDAVKDKDLAIQSGDVLKIFQIVQDRKVVRLVGAVQKEGEYGFSSGMTIKDLLHMAGGLKYYAYNKDAELTRVSVTNAGPKTEKITINIEKALNGDISSNIKLQENDYLLVRTVPEWQVYRTVTIQGEVKFPGTYTIKKGDKLSSIIERAGGYTDSAYLRGAVFIRESVKDMQQKSIEEMIIRLEREFIAGSSVSASTAVSSEEVSAKNTEMESKQKFIASLKKLKATGRISIRLAHLRLLKGSEYDIELHEGDNLHIPIKNSVVNVIGSVMSHSSLIYLEKHDYKDYIEMAGGYPRYADTDNVYVLKIDGSARKLSSGLISWNSLKSRWEMPAFIDEVKEIEPGDTIVVPEKLERIAWMREIRDITQILMQMAVIAAVVIKVLP